jgi:hypothetical protein
MSSDSPANPDEADPTQQEAQKEPFLFIKNIWSTIALWLRRPKERLDVKERKLLEQVAKLQGELYRHQELARRLRRLERVAAKQQRWEWQNDITRELDTTERKLTDLRSSAHKLGSREASKMRSRAAEFRWRANLLYPVQAFLGALAIGVFLYSGQIAKLDFKGEPLPLRSLFRVSDSGNSGKGGDGTSGKSDGPASTPAQVPRGMQVAEIHVKVDDVQVKVPDVQLKIPNVQVKVPDVQVKVPEVQLKVPDVQVNVPDVQVKVPDVQVKVPDVQVKVPDVQVKVPDVQVKVQDLQLRAPDKLPVEVKNFDANDQRAASDLSQKIKDATRNVRAAADDLSTHADAIQRAVNRKMQATLDQKGVNRLKGFTTAMKVLARRIGLLQALVEAAATSVDDDVKTSRRFAQEELASAKERSQRACRVVIDALSSLVRPTPEPEANSEEKP